MKSLCRWFAAAVALTGSVSAAFGFDLVPFVRSEVAKGGRVVTIPKGTYRLQLDTGKDCYFSFRGLRDVTIDFSGSRLNGSARARFMDLSGCTNVTVRNLTLDYPFELPFTQMEIIEVDKDRNWTLRPLKGYAEPDLQGYDDSLWPIQAYDRDTLELSNPMRFSGGIDIHKTADGTYRLTGGEDRSGKVGDICVISLRERRRPAAKHAFHSEHCVSNRFENVTIYSTPHGVFFNEYFCEANAYVNCRGVRCPPEEDPVPRAFRRVRSGNHDAFMSRGAVVGPKLIGCVAEYHSDDCVNIGGKYAIVVKSSGDSCRVLADGLASQLYPGYPAQAMSFDGDCYDVQVLSAERDAPPTAEERKYMSGLGFWPSVGESCVYALKVRLDRAVDLPAGSVIISSRQSGNGFEIRNCRFGHNRGQGLLIQASDGVIADTVIDHAWFNGMSIIVGYIWLEGSCSRNLLVTGNTIRNSMFGICVGGSSGSKKPLPEMAHRNLFFKDNAFSNLSQGAMSVTGCTGVSVFGNAYENIVRGPMLSFANCKDVCTNAPTSFPDWDRMTLEGRTDRERAIYAAGEEMTFTIRPAGRPGPIPEGRYFIDWNRSGDDGKTESGRVPLRADRPLVIRTRMSKPGFVRIVANVVDATGRKVPKNDPWEKRVFFEGGACVEPEKLRSLPEPADFDAYWKSVLSELDGVPITELERVELPSPDAAVKVFAVKVTCSGPRPVTGYLTVPVSAMKGGRHPANVVFLGASHAPQTPPGKVSRTHITFIPNAHGYELGRDADYYKEFFRSVEPHGQYYGFDPEENKCRDTSYLKQMAIRSIRAVQYVKTLAGWDGRTLSVGGGSMGSYQAMLAAAHVEGVSSADANGCWGLDWGGRVQGRLKSGFGPQEYEPETAYFDPCLHAKSVKCRVSIWSGLGDYVSPPSGLTVLFNQLAGPRTITYVQGSTHGYRPQGQQEFSLSAH